MSIENLEQIAQAMVAPGKGIIAVDESSSTIKKRLEAVGLENTEENRRAYRELLLTAPGLGEHISGAILFDETIRQKTADGRTMVQAMEQAGILPGIKVDKGTHPLAGFPGDVVTEGLEIDPGAQGSADPSVPRFEEVSGKPKRGRHVRP